MALFIVSRGILTPITPVEAKATLLLSTFILEAKELTTSFISSIPSFTQAFAFPLTTKRALREEVFTTFFV